MRKTNTSQRTSSARWCRFLSVLLVMLFMFSTMKVHAKTYTVSELSLQSKLPYDTVTYIGEGFYKVIKKSATGKEQWGIIDSTFNLIAPLADAVYDYMADVSEGLILVGCDTDGDKKTGTECKGIDKYGFIDPTGKVVIPLIFEYAESFSDGRALVYEYYDYEYTEGIFKGQITRRPLLGFIDKTGEIVIPAVYDRVASFVESSSSFYTLTPPVREEYPKGFSDGLACLRRDEKWGAVDVNGNVVVPFIYSYIYPFSEGLAAVKKDGKWGYVDTTGTRVIPCIYDRTDGFLNGMAIVQKEIYDANGNFDHYLSGAIDRNGILKVPMIYDSLHDFSDGMAVFVEQVDGVFKAGFVDTNGNVAVPATYDLASNFVDGLAKVGLTVEDADDRYQAKYGYIDKTGSVVIPLKYDRAEDFSEGIAAVGYVTKAETKEYFATVVYGYIDATGAEVIPITLGGAVSSKNGIAKAKPKESTKYFPIKNPLYEKYLETSTIPENTPLTTNAIPTSSKILINGKETSFDAYNINGNNYFKLRDLAQVLSGTEKQFEVTWNNDTRAINLVSGWSYTSVGGELAPGDKTDKVAQLSKSPIYLNGELIELMAYNIGGNNYFKLRDLGQVFDFDVSWDDANKTITVDTSQSYTAD